MDEKKPTFSSIWPSTALSLIMPIPVCPLAGDRQTGNHKQITSNIYPNNFKTASKLRRGEYMKEKCIVTP